MFEYKKPLRDQLTPKRLTIAMWDFSYLLRRNPAEGYENWDQCLDELAEREYNTVRIDVFPELILASENGKKEFCFPAIDRPHFRWGNVTDKVTVCPVDQIPEFVEKATNRGLKIILSTWWWGENIGLAPQTDKEMIEAWKATLRLMDKSGFSDKIAYVDISNEGDISAFSRFMPRADQMPPGSSRHWPYTEQQLQWTGRAVDSILSTLQDEFPHYRYTMSFTGADPDMIGRCDFQNMDVLEHHLYLEDRRFHDRIRWSDYSKALCNIGGFGEETFGVFSKRARIAVDKIGPMMAKWLWKKIQKLKLLGEALCVPVTNTESYGPWFMTEHPDVDWSWLKQWSEMGVKMSCEAGLWGTTTCSYAGPQFKELWADKQWHRRLNREFLDS